MNKRRLVPCACDACRNAKTKCDGKRPNCTRCVQRGKQCTFATGEGQTRQQALRDTNTDQLEQLSQYKRVFAMLLHDQNAMKLLFELRASAATTPDYMAMQTLLDEHPELSPSDTLETYSPEESPGPSYPFPRSPIPSYRIQTQYQMQPPPLQQQADEKRSAGTRFYQTGPGTYPAPAYLAPATFPFSPGFMDFAPLPAADYRFDINGGMGLAETQTDGTFAGVSLPDIQGQDDLLADMPVMPYSDFPPAYPGYFAPT